jgi:hypothetical protein
MEVITTVDNGRRYVTHRYASHKNDSKHLTKNTKYIKQLLAAQTYVVRVIWDRWDDADIYKLSWNYQNLDQELIKSDCLFFKFQILKSSTITIKTINNILTYFICITLTNIILLCILIIYQRSLCGVLSIAPNLGHYLYSIHLLRRYKIGILKRYTSIAPV